MGMSASQARYIALTARMNDVEYQGQQINQQRTRLSTQINEYYNQLLDMSVPTPPSVTDYTKTVYSGITGATKFSMGTVRPTGNNSFNIDLKYTMAGDAISKTNKTKTLVPNTPTLNYSSALAEATNKVFNTEIYTTYAVSNPITSFNEETADREQDIMILTTVGEAKKLQDTTTITGYTDSKGVEISGLDDLKDEEAIYVRCNLADIMESGACEGLVKSNEDETPSITNVFKQGTSVDNTRITFPKIGYNTETDKDANSRVANLGFYTCNGDPGIDNEPIPITTVEGLKEAIQLGKVFKQSANGDVEFKNPNYNTGNCDYLVRNGDDVTELFSLGSSEGQNALSKCDVSLENIVAGLRHSFNISENDMSDKSLLNAFSVYVVKTDSGEYSPYFIRNTDTTSLNENYTNIPTYEYNASGTYTQTTATENCKLEFDATGRITRIGIPSNGDYDWVDLSISEETDQEAYDDAMKDYNYEKILYDKMQEDINLKTSIVQQQDKNLELKLTRLDNERNALNTELEAVKKVVSDNIEKSYKTFSG